MVGSRYRDNAGLIHTTTFYRSNAADNGTPGTVDGELSLPAGPRRPAAGGTWKPTCWSTRWEEVPVRPKRSLLPVLTIVPNLQRQHLATLLPDHWVATTPAQA